MDLQNICENCFEAQIPACATEFKIGGFEADAELILYVENFHGKKNARDLQADGDGIITVPMNQFGQAFFNPDNSPYIFTFKSEVTDCTGLKFKQCVENVDTEFSCLAIDFIEVNDPELYSNVIDCPCE